MVFGAESLTPEKQAKFQRHIEARQSGIYIERDGRKVVDAKPALLNDSLDLGQTVLGAVVNLERATGKEAKLVNRENDCFECGFVGDVERTVDEDVGEV